MLSHDSNKLNKLQQWVKSNYLEVKWLSFEPIPSDAGSRSYFRLMLSNENKTSLIAVHSPPSEKMREFMDIQILMQSAKIHVPQILAHDIEQGFMLLTDLGNTSYLQTLKKVSINEAQHLMNAALDTLLRLQSIPYPHSFPLYDKTLLSNELQLFPDWYLSRHLNKPLNENVQKKLKTVFELLIINALTQTQAFVHRDFMPRNLMLDEGKVGVLDFQDAVYGPITYDVVSLLRDAFIQWEESFELDCIIRYWEKAKKKGLNVEKKFDDYYRILEWMGVQRHLKILGIFARLAYRDNKPHYLSDATRFIYYIRRVAKRYAALAPLYEIFDEMGLG